MNAKCISVRLRVPRHARAYKYSANAGARPLHVEYTLSWRVGMESSGYLRTLLRHFYFLLLLHSVRDVCGNNYTFTHPDSYAEYRWVNVQDGQAEFTFRTSQADALLFYQGNGNEAGDYLVLWLEGGRLKARCQVGGSVFETMFGDRVNDLGLHKLFILHTSNQFEFYLQDIYMRSLSYEVGLLYQARFRVYIGGLPSSLIPAYRPARRMRSFAGCLGDVMFADHSTNYLGSRSPVSKNHVVDGCSDGCESAAADCNGGTCVRSWATPRGYFCDCSFVSGVGEFCNIGESAIVLIISSLPHAPGNIINNRI